MRYKSNQDGQMSLSILRLSFSVLALLNIMPVSNMSLVISNAD